MDVIYSLTEKGNPLLCCNGYEYIQRKDRSNDGETVFWRCRYYKKFHCKATVKSVNGDLDFNGKHSHVSDLFK